MLFDISVQVNDIIYNKSILLVWKIEDFILFLKAELKFDYIKFAVQAIIFFLLMRKRCQITIRNDIQCPFDGFLLCLTTNYKLIFDK